LSLLLDDAGLTNGDTKGILWFRFFCFFLALSRSDTGGFPFAFGE